MITVQVCPGCAGPKESQAAVCCDRCWKRIPRDIPEQLRWRSTLKSARAMRTWSRVEVIMEGVKKWLKENPAG